MTQSVVDTGCRRVSGTHGVSEDWMLEDGGDVSVPASPLTQGWERMEPLPLSGSERRLFRLHRRLDGKDANKPATSAILVDARRETNASAHAPYLQRLQDLTSFLTKTGLRVPRIEAIDHAHSVAVVEDLGENSYARCLDKRGIEACRPLFQRAIDDLIRLSQSDSRHAPETLPAFSEERFVEQTMPFADAFLTKEQRLVWQELWRDLYRDAAFDERELAPVLGDVHIENMFAFSNNTSASNSSVSNSSACDGDEEGSGERCVFIDFQDAHIAPRCYDVVSLLEDGLWEMPTAQHEELWHRYEQAYAGHDIASAARHYALCALHRDLRMIGILYRLSHTRGEERYGAWLKTTVGRCRQRLAKQACFRFANIKEFLERNTAL